MSVSLYVHHDEAVTYVFYDQSALIIQLFDFSYLGPNEFSLLDLEDGQFEAFTRKN